MTAIMSAVYVGRCRGDHGSTPNGSLAFITGSDGRRMTTILHASDGMMTGRPSWVETKLLSRETDITPANLYELTQAEKVAILDRTLADNAERLSDFMLETAVSSIDEAFDRLISTYLQPMSSAEPQPLPPDILPGLPFVVEALPSPESRHLSALRDDILNVAADCWANGKPATRSKILSSVDASEQEIDEEVKALVEAGVFLLNRARRGVSYSKGSNA